MIRPAQADDTDKIIALCREFWDASCDGLGGFDESHTRSMLERYMMGGCCLVTDDVCGFILLVESENLCNPHPIAAEVAWYVTPSKRGGAGIELLRAAMRYCELKKIRCLSMMYMETSMPEAIKKIYDRMGLVQRETTYMKRFF